LNADMSRRVVIDTNAMEWQPSPSPGVWRKRLELIGGAETGRVTSLVRYAADSRFPAHPHPDGEEILVLDGVFSDQHGDFPAGSFLLNPDGVRHTPGSEAGCVLFVKLRQYPGTDRRRAAIDTGAMAWQETDAAGIWTKPLYAQPPYPETMALVRMEAGAQRPARHIPGGEELFVIEGTVGDENGQYGAGSWLREPGPQRGALSSADGCVLYVKSGRLCGA
jgi:anti-sigma factor ChrR (cupin superfamily)